MNSVYLIYGALISLFIHGALACGFFYLRSGNLHAALPFKEGVSVFTVSLAAESELQDADLPSNTPLPDLNFKLSPKKNAHIESAKKLNNLAKIRSEHTAHVNETDKKALGSLSQGVISAAALNGIVLPDYPEDARIKGHEGQVVYEMLLSPGGEISELALVRSSGFKSLDLAAREALLSTGKLTALASAAALRKKVGFTFKLTE